MENSRSIRKAGSDYVKLEGNSSSYLLAIWFNKIVDKTVVWYAKTCSYGPEDTIPVQVPSGSFLKLADGALSLREPSGNEVWNPRVTDVGYARMLNTSNFVLLGTNGTTKWESFSSSSDTILPTQVLPLGMALHNRLLAIDYSNGRFQLSVQQDGVDSMGDFFHHTTLDTDGVSRQYVYPKSIQTRRLWPRYKFFDDERKYKGCRLDFEPQSYDLDETTAMLQYEMTPVNRINWPLPDYERHNPIDETECRRLLPLSNGNMDSTLQAIVLLMVPRSSNSPSVLSNSSNKWKKDKKYWILGSSLLFGSCVLVNFLLIPVLLNARGCGGAEDETIGVGFVAPISIGISFNYPPVMGLPALGQTMLGLMARINPEINPLICDPETVT
uniref:non-specific serine/threonine protein kinase n=1 Tax=Oryza brachyantha TaxID=4533 RepID=J3LVY9_ORYBR